MPTRPTLARTTGPPISASLLGFGYCTAEPGGLSLLGQLAGRSVRRESVHVRLGGGPVAVAVGRVIVAAAGVADARPEHPGLLPDQFLHTPEAPSGQDRFCSLGPVVLMPEPRPGPTG